MHGKKLESNQLHFKFIRRINSVTMVNKQAHRKDEHVIIAEKLFHEQSQTQLNEVQPLLNNLPEINRDEVSLKTTIMGYEIDSPFFINAITGGSPQTDKYNLELAKVANKCKIPFATGSISVALKDSQYAVGFKKLRKYTQDTLLFTNLGAGNSVANAKKALELTQADGLQIHLNVAQEIVMPEGDRKFYWKENLIETQKTISKPLMVKEVGQGISPLTFNTLSKMGIKYIDLAAQGGTNFIKIENERRHDLHDYDYLAEIGLSLAKCLLGAQVIANDCSVTASGGIRTPLDIVKALCLGADNVGISGLFLHILLKKGPEHLIETINRFKEEIKDIMTFLGCRTIKELQQVPVILSPELLSYKLQVKSILKNKM